jgi:hypothetical protein
MTVFAIIVAAALALGWLAGMLTFRRSLKWCKECGEVLACLRCTRRTTSSRANSGTPMDVV